MNRFVPKAKLDLHEKREIKTLDDAKKELAAMHDTLKTWQNQITGDFKRVSQAQQNKSGNVTINVGGASGGSSGGGGSTTTGILPVAGFFTLVGLADTTIVYLRSISVSYVLAVYYMDSSGQFASVPVVQADQTANGFTLRAINEPGLGTYFYSVIPIQ